MGLFGLGKGSSTVLTKERRGPDSEPRVWLDVDVSRSMSAKPCLGVSDASASLAPRGTDATGYDMKIGDRASSPRDWRISRIRRGVVAE